MFLQPNLVWFATITILACMKTSHAVSLTSNPVIDCAIMLKNCQTKCDKGGRVIAIHWTISLLKGTLTCHEKMSDVPDPSKPAVEGPMTTSFDVRCCKGEPTERSSNQGSGNCTEDFAGMVNLLLLQEEKQEETLRLLSKNSTTQLKSQIQLVTVVAGATLVWVIVCCVMVLLNMIHRKRIRAAAEANKVEKKKKSQSKWTKEQEKTASTVVTIFDSETKSDSSGDFSSTTPHLRRNENAVNRNNQNSNQNRVKLSGHQVVGGFIVPTSSDDVTGQKCDVSQHDVRPDRVIVRGESRRQSGDNSGQSHREFDDDYVDAPPLKSSWAPRRVTPPQYNTLVPSSVDTEEPDYTKLQRDGAPTKTLAFKDKEDLVSQTEETTA